MSCGDKGDERAILPIAVLDLVSPLTLSPLFRVPEYLTSDLRVSSVARDAGRERALPERGL
jgi:hypothetical protein